MGNLSIFSFNSRSRHILAMKVFESSLKLDTFALSLQELYDKLSCDYHETEELEVDVDDDWD